MENAQSWQTHTVTINIIEPNGEEVEKDFIIDYATYSRCFPFEQENEIEIICINGKDANLPVFNGIIDELNTCMYLELTEIKANAH